ncbi:MAG: hypothetical protein JSV78_14975 [Phycisphaerales bacterium]|nr:MAG: hypothetical protein JSV78_14975 [Phycisphaerales bacterium]
MLRTHGSVQSGRHLGSLFRVNLSVLCLLAFTGYLFAQEPGPKGQGSKKPADETQKPEPKAPSKKPTQEGHNITPKPTQPRVIPAPNPKARPGLSSGRETPGKPAAPKSLRGTQRSKRGRASAGFQMDPNTKWACDKTVVELEPVWRGEDRLTFAFDIRNEGTADLRFRAKGG